MGEDRQESRAIERDESPPQILILIRGPYTGPHPAHHLSSIVHPAASETLAPYLDKPIFVYSQTADGYGAAAVGCPYGAGGTAI